MTDDLKRVNGQTWITPDTEKLCYFINGKLYEVSTSFSYETSAKVVKGNLLAIREGGIKPAIFPDDVDNIIGVAMNSTTGGKKEAVSIVNNGYLSLKSTDLDKVFIDKDLNTLNLGKLSDKYIWETKASDGKLMGVGAPVYWLIGRTYKDGEEYKTIESSSNAGFLTIGTPSGYKWKREDIDDESLNVGYDNLPQVGTIESYTVKNHKIDSMKIHINVSRFDTSLEWSWPYIHDGKCGKLEDTSFLIRHGLFVDNSFGAQLQNFCDICAEDEEGVQSTINTHTTDNIESENKGNRGTTFYIDTPENLSYKVSGRVNYRFDKHHENIIQIINNNSSMGTILGKTSYTYTTKTEPQEITWNETVFTARDGYSLGEFISTKGTVSEDKQKITIPSNTSGSIYVYVGWESQTYNILIDNSEVGGTVTLDESSKYYSTSPDDEVYTIVSTKVADGGYKFKNFTTNKGKIQDDDLTVYANTYGDITLSAHWQKSNYHIYINNTDTRMGEGPDSYEYTPDMVSATPFVLPKSDIHPYDGFEFKEYTSNEFEIDNTGADPVLLIPKGTSKDILIDLHWKGSSYSITCESQGEGGSIITEPTEYQTSLTSQVKKLNLSVQSDPNYTDRWECDDGTVRKEGEDYYLTLDAGVHKSIKVYVSWVGEAHSIHINNIDTTKGTIVGRTEYTYNFSKSEQTVEISERDTQFVPEAGYSPVFSVDSTLGSYNNTTRQLIINANVNTDINIDVDWDILKEIRVSSNTNRQFRGKEPNIEGVKVTAIYDKGGMAVVTNETTISPTTWTETGSKVITYSYTSGVTKTYEQSVNVEVGYLDTMDIGGEWQKPQYLGELIDPTGLTYTYYYTDRTEAGVINDANSPNYDHVNWTSLGRQWIKFNKNSSFGKVVYQDSPEVDVRENPKILTGLSLKEGTTWSKTQWAGTTPTKDGLVFIASFDNGTTSEVTSEVKLSPPAFKWESEERTQVTTYNYQYKNKTMSCQVSADVKKHPNALSTGSSEWSTTPQYMGDSVNTNGLVFTVSYDYGDNYVVTDHSKIIKSPSTWQSVGNPPCTFVYTQNGVEVTTSKRCSVIARPKHTITISAIQSTYGNPYCSPTQFTEGEETKVTLYPNANTGYALSNWVVDSDGTTTLSGNSLTIGTNCTYVTVRGNYKVRTYTIYTYGGSHGSVSPEDPTYVHGEGGTFTFTAEPDTDYEFVKWIKDGSDYSTNNPLTLVVSSTYNADIELTARFQKITYSLVGGTIFYTTGSLSGYSFYDSSYNEITERTIDKLKYAKYYRKTGTGTHVYVCGQGFHGPYQFGAMGTEIGATSTGIGAGKTNSTKCLNNSASFTPSSGGGIATQTIWKYLRDNINGQSSGGCSDWYIGSTAENDELKKSGIGVAYDDTFVWSSQENGSSCAYCWDYITQGWSKYVNKHSDAYVIVMRSF